MKETNLWFLTHDKEDILNQLWNRTWLNKNRLKASCFGVIGRNKQREYTNNQTKMARLTHGVKITNTVQGGRAKAGLPRRKKEAFNIRLNTVDYGGALHIEHNAMNEFAPPTPFSTPGHVNRVSLVLTCFAVLAYSCCSPPFADQDQEWNKEGEAREVKETGETQAKNLLMWYVALLAWPEQKLCAF
jgi:hypothetical protein